MNENNRFVTVVANSMVELIMAINEHAEKLGQCIYFGECKKTTYSLSSNGDTNFMGVSSDLEHPFIAVFDSAATLVMTLEDLHDMRENEQDIEIDTSLKNNKVVLSA